MSRPVPAPVVHVMHVDHLGMIVHRGLLADTDAQAAVEVGDRGIKHRRLARGVPMAPGGVVADYVPFYFAPRSPMMYAIEKGAVPTYTAGCDQLVYLVSSVEQLTQLGLPTLFTDRNAALALASFTARAEALDDLVDGTLMAATMWNDTADEPDRRERRSRVPRSPAGAVDRVPRSGDAKQGRCALRAGDPVVGRLDGARCCQTRVVFLMRGTGSHDQ